MSASALLGCLITPGREEEARGVLRDYAAHLEGFRGSVTAHRVVFAADVVSPPGAEREGWTCRVVRMPHRN